MQEGFTEKQVVFAVRQTLVWARSIKRDLGLPGHGIDLL